MKSTVLYTSLLAAMFTCQTASATLIFSDNFNTANTDLNSEVASRQSGSAATKTYSSGGDGSKYIEANSLRLSLPSGSSNHDTYAWINYDFATDPNLLTNGGAYKVTFDMLHNTRSYAAFTMGGTATPGNRPLISTNTDIGILMDYTGRVAILHNNVEKLNNLSAVTAFGNAFVPVEITVTTANFLLNTPFSMTMSINNQIVNLGSAANGTWDGNGTNYMSFSMRDSTANPLATSGTRLTRFDNITVTAIPEPGSLLLLGLSGLAMALLYRRRSR